MPKAKLAKLAEIEGYADWFDMVESYATDSVAPGICMNADCDYTVIVEPDCHDGYCENCQTNSVKSCLILGGFI